MTDFVLNINDFPKDIQIIIGMFNVEHRKMMREVCLEIEIVECDFCCSKFTKREMLKNEIYNETFYYCCQECMFEDVYDIRRAYARAVPRV
jgi:hypothetical protein